LKSILPDALLLPPNDIHNIINLIENKEFKIKGKSELFYDKDFKNVIAPISIAEGCNFACTYCITHLARGRLTSFPMKFVINDVKNALKAGCKEIQITSQDTASYGMDKGQNLAKLLEEICAIDNNFRTRVGMMNPFTAHKILDKLIPSFKDEKIYKFIHIPVQSADNEILKKMNRKYNISMFLEVVNYFKKTYTKITISTDIIVGFPGESENAFQNSIDLIKKIKPDIVNITRFSARPNTKAKKMKGRIPTEIVKNRSKILTDLSKKISFERNISCKDSTFNILITKKLSDQCYLGRAGNYKPVVIKENAKVKNFYNVKITNADSVHLYGKLI
jgi:MiaB-like tRNA modifying enzyme